MDLKFLPNHEKTFIFKLLNNVQVVSMTKDGGNKYSPIKGESLFVFEGKSDSLIIGVVFLLVAFFLFGGFFLK